MEKYPQNPKISVVTVVKNDAGKLEKTLLSVIMQDYKNLEFIVIDGASTDGSLELIKKYESGITKLISEKDTGIYNAMNKGIDCCTGDYVCFLNSGDVFYKPDVLTKIAKGITDLQNNADIVYGDIMTAGKDGALKEVIAKEPCNIHRMYFCHQSAFTRLKLLKKFRFDEKFRLSSDLKFFKQCYYDNCTFCHFHFPVVIYDKSGLSNVSRTAGLMENAAVVRQMDRGLKKYRLLLKLYFVIYWRKINGKK